MVFLALFQLLFDQIDIHNFYYFSSKCRTIREIIISYFMLTILQHTIFFDYMQNIFFYYKFFPYLCILFEN